jgi:hypothetical protein
MAGVEKPDARSGFQQYEGRDRDSEFDQAGALLGSG